MTRVFEDKPAVRSEVPLLIGLCGPSGSGKTFSALRLATGIQRIAGGDIWCVDTEANRALHYADKATFRHVSFKAPFDALSYLAAVEHCVRKGAKTIIIDSASHLHEGPGGTLEMHEAECVRLMETWKTSRDKVQMAAWQKPKAQLRQFLNAVLQLQVNTIWCFRAKDKIKVVPGKPPQELGFMPIAGDEMVYEMTLNCLLYPNSGGIPQWHPAELGERAIVKLPEQFKAIFVDVRPLDEGIGEALAQWAKGADRPKTGESVVLQRQEPDKLSAEEIEGLVDEMNNATDLAGLEGAYKDAVKFANAAKDSAAKMRFVGVKDLRKKDIESRMTQASLAQPEDF